MRKLINFIYKKNLDLIDKVGENKFNPKEVSIILFLNTIAS